MADSPALELQRVRRQFGSVVAVDDVSLAVGKGEFVTLLGPSGSGKTSTLRLIGGFETLDGGSISIDGRRVDHLPAYRRDTATIFQSGALFPHKTVGENIAYGLRMRGVAKAEIATRIGKALDIVRLSGYEQRFPAALSGGQKQRVALARSLVVEPAILLFDEPLSALDLSLRMQLRAEIKRLHDQIGFTAIFVTHDQGEAMAMSSRVAVMNRGAIRQIDTPERVYEEPADEFVYTFIGESCCLPVRVTQGKTHDTEGKALDLRLQRPLEDGAWRIYLRPYRLALGGQVVTAENRLTAQLAFVEFLGEFRRYHLRAGNLELFIDQRDGLALQPGDRVEIGWASRDMRAYR
ncbi:MAG: ABC transporter ATP-binding protein [Mesorhizobium sp.]